MAQNYKQFSSTVSKNFRYRFTCEHCGKDSGWIRATVYGTGRSQLPASTKSISSQQSTALHAAAAQDLATRYEKVKQLAANNSYNEISKVAEGSDEKGSAYQDYSDRSVGFPADCPSCKKTQSWQTGGYLAFIAVPTVALPLLFALIWVLVSGQMGSGSFGDFFENVPLPVWLAGVGVGLALGVIWYILQKKRATNGKVRNKPEFSWE